MVFFAAQLFTRFNIFISCGEREGDTSHAALRRVCFKRP